MPKGIDYLSTLYENNSRKPKLPSTNVDEDQRSETIVFVWFIYVIKIGPWSNKIKQMRKQNIEDTQYNRDTDLHGSPNVGYVHQRNCQVLPLLLSSK
jgi:hypothetical protein